MICFEELFLESKGLPVEYLGRLIQMVDRLPMRGKTGIVVSFESTNSPWRQGVQISTKGEFEVNGIIIKSNLVLWEDTAPQIVKVIVRPADSECLIKNVWDTGDGVMHSWHNGAAMIVESTDNGRRYKCNDGKADDDFDDLVVRIEAF